MEVEELAAAEEAVVATAVVADPEAVETAVEEVVAVVGNHTRGTI